MTSPAEFQRRFQRTDEQNTTDFQKQMDAHRAKAEQVRQNAQQQIDRIGQRQELTLEAKRSAAARVYKPARATTQQLLEQHVDMVRQHKQALARKAFGSDNAADPMTAMARRQARQQAAGIQDHHEATEAIRNAQFDGDTHLARAIAAKAFENGWHDVVDTWNADGSNNAYMQPLIELMQMPDTDNLQWRMETAMQYAPPLPGVLEGMKDHEITRAAEEGPEVA
ncbi:hypothetical protein [Streptomyces sp. S063]|uniref:hypothetical protein n=1 Tax=Streptomyces sp. S063 TaxID=2005885 RepID=UPI0010084A3A|nr:hypothetical protein [Streptomyces sp. S063]